MRERLEQRGGEESGRARWSQEISVCVSVWGRRRGKGRIRDVDDEALSSPSRFLFIWLSYCIKILSLHCSWHSCLFGMYGETHTQTITSVHIGIVAIQHFHNAKTLKCFICSTQTIRSFALSDLNYVILMYLNDIFYTFNGGGLESLLPVQTDL